MGRAVQVHPQGNRGPAGVCDPVRDQAVAAQVSADLPAQFFKLLPEGGGRPGFLPGKFRVLVQGAAQSNQSFSLVETVFSDREMGRRG